MLASPLFVILRVVEDSSTLLTSMYNDMANIGPRRSFFYTFNSVIFFGKFRFEGFENIDLCAFTQFLIGLILQSTLKIANLGQELILIFKRSCLLDVDSRLFALLHDLALLYQIPL